MKPDTTIIIGIIFAQETIGPSDSWLALDSSQKIASWYGKNMKLAIKLHVFDHMS
jgi:hypothetical protein